MHLSQALRLKEGAEVRYKPTGEKLTVVEVWQEETPGRPGGRYPLVVTREKGPVTYFALRLPVKLKS
jgi:hypothetical protein